MNCLSVTTIFNNTLYTRADLCHTSDTCVW